MEFSHPSWLGPSVVFVSSGWKRSPQHSLLQGELLSPWLLADLQLACTSPLVRLLLMNCVFVSLHSRLC